MFGKLIGDIVAAPVRIVNIPVRVTEAVVGDTGIGDVIEDVADAVDDSVAEVMGEDDE